MQLCKGHTNLASGASPWRVLRPTKPQLNECCGAGRVADSSDSMQGQGANDDVVRMRRRIQELELENEKLIDKAVSRVVRWTSCPQLTQIVPFDEHFDSALQQFRDACHCGCMPALRWLQPGRPKVQEHWRMSSSVEAGGELQRCHGAACLVGSSAPATEAPGIRTTQPFLELLASSNLAPRAAIGFAVRQRWRMRCCGPSLHRFARPMRTQWSILNLVLGRKRLKELCRERDSFGKPSQAGQRHSSTGSTFAS